MQTSIISEEAKERSPETIFLQWWDNPIQWCKDRIDHEEYEDTEYRRSDLPPALTPEQRDAIVAGMIAIIKQLSEEYYRSEWYGNVEFLFWEAMTCNIGKFTPYGNHLLQISNLINGWVYVPKGADDPQFIPMDEWLKLFEEWKGKQS